MADLQVSKDLDALTITVTAHLDAGPDRVWQLYADPRQLERWWGPPGFPATVLDHDLTPGGTVRYLMTGPEGEQYHGYWQVQQVDAPSSFTVVDGFADESGTPNTELPTMTMAVNLGPDGDGTRLEAVSTFASREALEQLLAMEMEEGLRQSMGQMDDVLTAP